MLPTPNIMRGMSGNISELRVTTRCIARLYYKYPAMTGLYYMDKYKFPTMLGPASSHPAGSPDWAEAYGNELEYTAERAVYHGVDDLLGVIQRLVAAEPWTAPNPIGATRDEFIERTTGFTYRQLWTLIDTFVPRHGLPSRIPGGTPDPI